MESMASKRNQVLRARNFHTTIDVHKFDNLESVKWYVGKSSLQFCQRYSTECRSPKFNNRRFQLEMKCDTNNVTFAFKCLQGTPQPLKGEIVVLNHRFQVLYSGNGVVGPSPELNSKALRSSNGFRVWCRIKDHNAAATAEAQTTTANKRRRVENANDESDAEDASDDNLHRDLVLNTWRKLYCNPYLSDLTLLVGPERIPAHRVVLYAANVTFREMLPSADDVSAGRTNVRITNVEPDLLWLVLRFIYAGNIPPDSIGERAWQLAGHQPVKFGDAEAQV